MKLIPNWRRAWRLTSVQAAALLTLVSLVQSDALPLIKFAVPAEYWPWVTAAFGLAVIVLRVWAQPGALTPPDKAAPK